MNTRKILSTILVIIWMITIFYFSHQQGTGSSNTSKKVAMIIVNIYDIKNEMSEQQKEDAAIAIDPIVRKLAHYSIYMVGGVLLINCAYAYVKEDKRAVLYSSIMGVIYAASDEIHQLFVGGRSGRIADVAIDSIGVFTGIAVFLFGKKILSFIVDRGKRIKGGRVE